MDSVALNKHGALLISTYVNHSWKVDSQSVMHLCSVAQLCLTLATPWTVASQAPLSMELFRQEYWSGLPLPPPGDLP